MAFNISVDEAPHVEAPIGTTFDDFYDANVDVIAIALSLSCDDDALTEEVLSVALVSCAHRWRYLANHANPVGWALDRGLSSAAKAQRNAPSTGVNIAAGGYSRGLELAPAIAALPLSQRAALVAAYFLEWSDDHTAAGSEVAVVTVTTRRIRALSFLSHHLRIPTTDVETAVAEYLAEQATAGAPLPPDSPEVRRRGRWRTIRNRTAAVLGVGLLIAAGGAALRIQPDEPTVELPEPVAAPNASRAWLAPVSDGQGGFIALNREGASQFVRTDDGVEWFDEATWNSRSINLRTFVSGFERSDDRYLATIEVGPAISQFVPPYIATSRDLIDWSVQQLDQIEPDTVEGLRSSPEVLAVAASGPLVLASVQVTSQIDYSSFGILSADLCVESTTTDRLIFGMCDGSTIEVDRPAADSAGPRFFLSEEGGRFFEVDPPVDVEARSLVGFGRGFAGVDPTTGDVWLSDDGQNWQPGQSNGDGNRFVLVAGSARDEALVIRPDAAGWATSLIDLDGTQVQGELPLNLDPATVWTTPEIAAGPAGWAVLVTTSRPWDRIDVTPGWAVDTGAWIVSQLPRSPLIAAQSADGTTTHRFVESADQVSIDEAGVISLQLPDMNGASGEVLEVTPQQIAETRDVRPSGTDIKTQVFFSPDGQTWREIWHGTGDTWFGSLAVGDDEVLISGSTLTARPIAVPLG